MDTNMFLQKNKVDWTYNRYLIGYDERETEFISIKPNPPLNTGKYVRNRY